MICAARIIKTEAVRMKPIVILTFLACGASAPLITTAQGQTATPAVAATASPSPASDPAGHHRHGDMLEHLTRTLSLSGTQEAAIAPILEAAKPQMKAVYENAKAQRNSVIDSVSGQITPLLDPDQQAKFSTMVKRLEAKPFGAWRMERRAGGDLLERLTTALDLTTEEQSQIKPIIEAARTQIKSVWQDTSLTMDEKRSEIKDAMQAAYGQINGILTQPQQAKLAEMKEHAHRRWHGAGSQPSASPDNAASPSPSPASE